MSPSSVPPLQLSSLVDADARERSRIARQRRSLIVRKRNAARSMAAFSRLAVERDAGGVGSDTQNNRKGLYSSLDNTKLRLFIKKELNNHDVGSLGRILLPKKEVEKHLPILSNKEGIQLLIRHTLSKWGSKNKYWSNNKSRMHVFENSVGNGSKTQNNKQDLYSFCTPDNMTLRLLFRKELKNSDTGSYGRIVLPKKDAEKCLPSLFDKEGIKLMIRDVHSNQQWDFKFKYWPNNKSRMYVFENTGDFVRQSGVKVGDSINLYEDECKNLYISIQKAEARPVYVPEPSSYQQSCYTITKDDADNCCSSHIDDVEYGKANTINNNSSSNKDNSNSLEKNANPNIDNTNWKIHAKATSRYIPYAEVRPEEDESSLAVLQQHKEHLETNMAELFEGDTSSHRQSKEASNNSNDSLSGQIRTSSTQQATAGTFVASSPSASLTIMKMADDIFYNCCEGLGRLPDVGYCDHFTSDFTE